MGLTLILVLNQVSSGLPESILVAGPKPHRRPCLFLTKPPLFHAQLDVSLPLREGTTMSLTMIHGTTKKRTTTKSPLLSLLCAGFSISRNSSKPNMSPGLGQKFLQPTGDVMWKLSEEKLEAVCKLHLLSFSG